jgi:macrolide transport system ATP-binding/permease protein
MEVGMLDSWIQDVRYGVRGLIHSPGLTAIVVLTIALGIGANGATFSIVNGFLIRPFPAPAPEQLTVLAIGEKNAPLGSSGFSYPEFASFREEAKPLCEVVGQALGGTLSLTSDGRSEGISVSAVTDNYFSGLQIRPAMGRLILPSDGEAPQGEGLLVLGYSYWQRRFRGDPNVVGKSMQLNGGPVTIIGVVPKEFRGSFAGFEMDGYVPFSAVFHGSSSSLSFWSDRRLRMILAMGRLAPGVTISKAQSSFDLIFRRFGEQYPDTDRGLTIRVLPERLARPIPYANNAFILISVLFMALSVLVLLLACTNVANVLMARASVRLREMAIRTALGASRSRLVRQVLTETLLLALVGGVAGLLVAAGANALIDSIHLPNLPLQLNARVDWIVVAYASVVVLATGIFVGLSPAFAASRSDVNVALRQGSPTNTSRHSMHRDLMVVQVAASLTLLIVAGLFIRSLQRAEHLDLGFDPNHVLNVTLDPEQHNYTKAQTIAFYRELERRVRDLPGVAATSLAVSVPIAYFPNKQNVYVEGSHLLPGDRAASILYNRIDPDYFRTMRIGLVYGRTFTESDNATSAPVAIINQMMAKRFWPGSDPVGKRFSTTGESGPFLEVIGVAGDSKYQTIAEDAQSYFYVPLAQNYSSSEVLQTRASIPLDSLGMQVQHAIMDLDPTMPILDIESMQQSLAGATGFFIFRLGAYLAALAGLTGMILAVIGVYGVVSYSVTKRTREIGIRIALGANRLQILTLVVGQGLRLVLGGLAVGWISAWGLGLLMRHLLVGITPNDPVVYAGVSILLATVAVLACGVPARRAAAVDPMVALRQE